jgi:HAD superfamily hydrolase (TIGR01509 family)
MIQGIFFDPSGIFYNHEEPANRYALRLLKDQDYITDISAEDEARLENIKERAHDGIISANAYWDEFLKVRGVADPGKRTELMDRILEQLNRVYGLPGAHETMKTLKKRGFVMGIITSTMYPIEWKMSWLKVAGVAEFIDVVACSAELGSRKPHPSIYWTALNKAHLTPHQTAYVAKGAKGLAGAHRVGMVTVAALYDPDVEADYYAKTLPDLLTVPIFQK